MKRSAQSVFFSLFTLVVLAATFALAQSTATLQGTVTDQSGAVVPKARVTVTNQETNLTRTSETDTTGNFLVPSLPAGVSQD
jgi:type 1 fimbria pilin